MIEKIKNYCTTGVKELKNRFIMYLPVIILGIALCFSIIFIIGEPVVVVGVVAMLSIKGLYKTTFNLQNYIRYALEFFVIVLFGTLACFNFFLAIIINAVLLFCFAYVYSDNFKLGGYFTLSLQLLLMQYQGAIPFNHLGYRLLCCVYCIAVCGVFLLVFNNLFNKHNDSKYVTKGCKAISDMLSSLISEEVNQKEDIFSLTTNFCKENYIDMCNQGYILDETAKHNFLALMTLQQLSDLIYDSATKLGELTQQDIDYFSKLQKHFEKQKSLKRLAIELSNFVDDNSLSNPQLSSLWKKYLLTLSGYLKYNAKPVIKTSLKTAYKFRRLVMQKRFSLSSYCTRNALQLVSIITIGCVLAWLIPLKQTILIPIMSLAVLTVYPNGKFRNTIKGGAEVVLCIAFYMLILTLLPLELRVAVAIILSIIGVFLCNSSFGQSIFAVQLVAGVMYPTTMVGADSLVKILFVVMAFVLAGLLAKWIFHTIDIRRYKLHIGDLAQLNWTQLSFLSRATLNEGTEHYLCEMMMIQYLLVDHLSNGTEQQIISDKIRYSNMLSYNCDLLSEIAYALTILRLSKLPYDWMLAMKKRLTNIF